MIREALNLDDVFKTLKGWVSDGAQWLYDQFKESVASVYGAFKATYDNIGSLWKNLPSLVGEGVKLAVNLVITAVQNQINAAVAGLNWLAEKSNAIFGTSFTKIAPIDLSGWKMQYSAAGKAFGDAWSNSYDEARKTALASFGRFEDATIARRNARLKAQADEIIKDRKDKAEKAAKAESDAAEKIYKQMMVARAEAQGNVNKLFDEMVKRQQDWGKDQVTVGETMIQQAKDLEDLEQARAEGARQILDVYLRQLDLLQQMGGALGGVAGIVAGILDGGNFAGVGGKLGSLLNLTSAVVGKDGWEQVTKKLDSIFGGEGQFAKTMTGVMQDAGMGSLASSMLLGKDGSKLGASIGGAIGGKLGEKFLSKGFETIAKGLGDFAGPIGSIVGGLLGGALGGLFKKAKWGTAVVTGQGADDVTVSGNKAAYRSNANLAATSIQSGLQSIADQFGAGIGGYNVSIGQYKGKWRVSTTGYDGKLNFKGNTGATGKGLNDFGKEGAEDAIKFAIADAVKDGALLGLRASTQRLLQGSDDIEGQIAKAMSFEGVFTDLKARLDPAGAALEQLSKRFDGLRKTFDEAGATTEEYGQLEQLLTMQRQDILDEAAKDALEKLNERRELEVRLLTAQGKASEALALQREIELSQTKDELKSLMAQVLAVEDAAAISSQRRSMEITLLEAQGKSSEALALRRQAELDAMDASLRPLQEQIYAWQDAAAAQADAQEQARSAADLADQRQAKQIELLEAMGQSSAALALRRQMELSAIEESLRPMQLQIYAWQDLADAQAKAAQKVSDARDLLSSAYDRESAQLVSTAAQFRDFAKTIGDFRAGLLASGLGGNSYDQARARFDNTASMAQFGNEASLQAFTSDAQAFLDASRNRAGSALDYARDVARVAAAAGLAQAGAEGVASAADQQLAALKKSVEQLIDLDDSVISVAQAIADLKAAQGEADRLQLEVDQASNALPALAEVNANLTDMTSIIDKLNSSQDATNSQIAALRSEMQAALVSIASNTGESARILRRADRGDAIATQVETA
ncbi:coiled-coil domain-containing protein [Sphingobium mellinum]|uniref:hypothetical protein n=1 Tax=Sphingobium mellinum TaxID=1387166 RepID=UPI0030EC2345